MKDTGHVTEKLILIFRLLGVCHRFSINIRIEVHFFVCNGKWKDTGRVKIFEKRFALYKFYTWPVILADALFGLTLVKRDNPKVLCLKATEGSD